MPKQEGDESAGCFSRGLKFRPFFYATNSVSACCVCARVHAEILRRQGSVNLYMACRDTNNNMPAAIAALVQHRRLGTQVQVDLSGSTEVQRFPYPRQQPSPELSAWPSASAEQQPSAGIRKGNHTKIYEELPKLNHVYIKAAELVSDSRRIGYVISTREHERQRAERKKATLPVCTTLFL